MERLKHIKDTLVSCIESQMGDLKNVEAKELGEVVDMVKDMEEAMYYCTITKAMEKREKEEEESYKHKGFHQTQPHYVPMPMPMYYPPQEEQFERDLGHMYYGGSSMGSYARGNQGGSSSYARGGYNPSARGNNARGGGTRGFYDPMIAMEYGMGEMMGGGYPAEIRDVREGRSPMSRRSYMESKEMHHGGPAQMKELEKYIHELSEDLTEMIEDASPEEKQVLQQKLSGLAQKIK